MDLTNFKLNIKHKLQYFFSEIFPAIFILFCFVIIILANVHSFGRGVNIGKLEGIKETKELYQKELIERNLAVYDELTGQWTMLDSNQIVQNLIKYKKIDINKFVPPNVSGIKECFCGDKNKNVNNTISTDELFNGIENLDLEKIAGIDKKLVAKNPVKKKR